MEDREPLGATSSEKRLHHFLSLLISKYMQPIWSASPQAVLNLPECPSQFPQFLASLSLFFFFFFLQFSLELVSYFTLLPVSVSSKQLRTLNMCRLIWCYSGSASELWELAVELWLEVAPLQNSPKGSWAHKPTERVGHFARWHRSLQLPPPLYRTGKCEQHNPRVAN